MVNSEISVKGLVGVATTNAEKFTVFQDLISELEISGVALEQIPIYGGVEEPIDINRKVVGKGKMANIVKAIEASSSWQEREIYPDWLLIMDVLAVAQLGKGKEIVMKKPEEGELALDVFTAFFAECWDQMAQEGNKSDLQLAYYMIHAISPVDSRGKVDVDAIRVEWDTMYFLISKELVDILKDPDQLKEYARKGIFGLEAILGSDTIVGFRIQTLLPEIVRLAGSVDRSGVELDVIYERGQSWCKIDSACDLYNPENDVNTGVSMGEQNNDNIPLLDFTYWAVKNVTPWLLTKVITKRNHKRR